MSFWSSTVSSFTLINFAIEQKSFLWLNICWDVVDMPHECEQQRDRERYPEGHPKKLEPILTSLRRLQQLAMSEV